MASSPPDVSMWGGATALIDYLFPIGAHPTPLAMTAQPRKGCHATSSTSAGQTLPCDCRREGEVCEADALAGLVFDATALQAPSQEGVITCFRRLFPGDWFRQFKFPMIED